MTAKLVKPTKSKKGMTRKDITALLNAANGVSTAPNKRVTHRKPKYIATPELMWQLFCNYKKQIKENPKEVHDFAGKDAYEVYRFRERPLTFEGFTRYLYDEEIIADITDYFENKQNRYALYVHVCSRIKNAIREDQIDGGMTQIYNTSITQRLNSLVDKSQVETKTEQPLFPDVKK